RDKAGDWADAGAGSVAHAASSPKATSPARRIVPSSLRPRCGGEPAAAQALWRVGQRFAYQSLMTTETSAPRARPGPNQLLIDLGPVAIFVVAYNVLQRIEATKADAVYIATAIFIVATLAAVAWCKVKIGRIPPVLIVTGVLVTAFGGL